MVSRVARRDERECGSQDGVGWFGIADRGDWDGRLMTLVDAGEGNGPATADGANTGEAPVL